MSDTTQAPVAPEIKTKFNGRDFVPADEPSGESPSPADGNDYGGAVADEEVPSSTSSDEPKAGDDGPAGEAGAEGGEPTKDLWEQTPEDKRRERFQHALEHSNALAKERDEYKAKLAKYEAGEGPKPKEPEPATVADAAPEAEQTVEDIIGKAIDPEAKAEELSENQKRIRAFSQEVVELRKELVLPARKTYESTTADLAKANAALSKLQSRLEHLKEMSEGNEGLYDSEMSATRDQIRLAQQTLTMAKSDHVNARLDLKDAEEKVALRQATNLTKAKALAAQDGRRHQETASRSKAESEHEAEVARWNKVWDDDLKAVIADLKIPDEDKADAEAVAFAKVQFISSQRGKENPVMETEFKTLIQQALSRMATRATSIAGRSEAEIAAEREKATSQPAPRKRTASSNSDAPPSVEEARRELKSVFESKRVRVRAA